MAENKEVSKKNTEITDSVLSKITAMQEMGQLELPPNYSAANALKAAWLVLQGVEDRDGKKALDVCTPTSIAMSLLNMVTDGLSVAKKQCYFIVYAKELQYQKSYFGNISLAKRMAGIVHVNGQVVYEGDLNSFIYKVDPNTGRKQIVKHEPKLTSIDNNKISAAYAIVTYEDGSTDAEVMTYQQIKQSWLQGSAKGNSPAHRNFPDQMAIRTVINRAIKIALSSSDDSYLGNEESVEEKPKGKIVEIEEHGTQEAEIVEDKAENVENVSEEKQESSKGDVEF